MSGNTQISASTGGTITLKLPSGLTCNHCVFQVKNLKNIKAKFTRLKIKEINFFFIQLSGNIILVKPFYLNLKT